MAFGRLQHWYHHGLWYDAVGNLRPLAVYEVGAEGILNNALPPSVVA